LIAPVRFRRVASGFNMEKVRSSGMLSLDKKVKFDRRFIADGRRVPGRRLPERKAGKILQLDPMPPPPNRAGPMLAASHNNQEATLTIPPR
jgi:hypothetical protein